MLGRPLGCGGWLWDSKTTALCHLFACAGCSPRARGTCTQDGGCSAGRPICYLKPSGALIRAANSLIAYRTIVPLSRQLFPRGRGGTLKFLCTPGNEYCGIRPGTLLSGLAGSYWKAPPIEIGASGLRPVVRLRGREFCVFRRRRPTIGAGCLCPRHQARIHSPARRLDCGIYSATFITGLRRIWFALTRRGRHV